MASALAAVPRRHARLVATTLILLLAYVLRLYHLGYDSIWYDEGVSIYLAGLDLPAMIAHTAGDIHPPLYYALLHLWSLAAGSSEFSIAFFSLFFGMLLLALTYRVAARFFGPATALLAALLVAFSAFNVWYSQEMRMYTLGSFLALLCTYCLVLLLSAGSRWRDWRIPWLGYVLSAAAGIYSLYYFFFVLVFQNLYAVAVLVRRWRGGHTGPPLRPSASPECADSVGAVPVRATTRVAPTDMAPAFRTPHSAFRIPDSASPPPRPSVPFRAFPWPVRPRTPLRIPHFTFRIPPPSLRLRRLRFPALPRLSLAGPSPDRTPHSALRIPHSALLWLAAQLALLVLYLPWLPIAFRQATQPPVPPWRSFTNLWDMAVESWSALSLGQSAALSWAWPLLALFAGLYLLGLCHPGAAPSGSDPAFRTPHSAIGIPRLSVPFRGPSVPRPHSALVAYTFLPLAIIFLLSLAIPLYHVRYVFTYAAAFYILIAAGLAMLLRRRTALRVTLFGAVLVVLTAGSAVSLQAYFSSPAYAPDDHRDAVRYLSDGWRPGDAIIVNAGYVYPVLTYYYQGDIAWRGRLSDYAANPPAPAVQGAVLLQTGSIDGSAQLGWGSPTSDFYATTAAEVTAALDAVARRHPRLWVYRCYDTVTDPQGVLRDYLSRHLRLLDDVGFPGSSYVRVQLYESPYPQPAVNPSAYNFARQVTLYADSAAHQGQSGKPLYLTLNWRRIAELDDDLSAVVSLRDSTGVLAAWDAVPVGLLLPSRQWPLGETLRDPRRLDIPLGLPPGDYRLTANVYRRTDGRRLALVLDDARPAVTEADLGTVRIAKADLPVDVTKLPIQVALQANLGDAVDLLGYAGVEPRLAPGHALYTTLFWRARRDLTEDYTAFLQLLDKDGKPWAATDAAPWHGAYPTSRWQAGEVVRETYGLLLAPDAPDGDYRLVAGLYRATDKRRLPLAGPFQSGDAVTLGTVRVAGSPRSFSVPPIGHALNYRLGDRIVLLGYDGPPGGLTLYWQALGRMDKSYTVFVHVVDEQGAIRGQVDRLPADGLFPTTTWLTGQVLTDNVGIPLDPRAPSFTYRLVLGLYDALTGQRLPVVDPAGKSLGDAVVLGPYTR